MSSLTKNQLNTIKTACYNTPTLLFVKDHNFDFMDANEKFIQSAQFSHLSQLTGKSDLDCPWHEFTDEYRSDDESVIAGNSLVKKDIFINQGELSVVSVTKRPIIENNTIIGLAGWFHLSKNHTVILNTPMPLWAKGTVLSNQLVKKYFYGISAQEAKVWFYLIRGFGARQIGEMIFLSQKTVEFYINNLKLKLDCNSKTQLIYKAFDCQFINIIPTCVVR